MKRKTLFVLALAGLVLAFVAGALIYNAQRDEQAAQLALANRAALLRMHSPSVGRADAPVVIVEFLDPACETCREFYPLVKKMLAAHPEQIRLVLRHAPFHEGSDKVVALLEAARRQGKFWEALEALLVAQRDWVVNHRPQLMRAWRHIERLGLDMERLRFDMTAPEIADAIAQDVADARTLGVTKTPEFFVNGRPLPEFGYEQLKKLVDDAVKEDKRR